jgi:hypothetical protein
MNNMRWKSKDYRTELGVWVRKHKRFLLFPKKIHNEWRWMEWAEWESRKENHIWIDINWVN